MFAQSQMSVPAGSGSESAEVKFGGALLRSREHGFFHGYGMISRTVERQKARNGVATTRFPSSKFRKSPFDTGWSIYYCSSAKLPDSKRTRSSFPQLKTTTPGPVNRFLPSCSSRRRRIVKWRKNAKIPKEEEEAKSEEAQPHLTRASQSKRKSTRKDKKQASQKRRTKIYLKVEKQENNSQTTK